LIPEPTLNLVVSARWEGLLRVVGLLLPGKRKKGG
jgi:hypothetical protein